ncbi:MAG: assimilatory sulfite reductase (NADPH) flavoprotein subunit [Arenimonas sp.]
MNATLATALTSPLSEERAGLLLRLTDGLEPSALQWLSGYTAGLAAQLSPTQRVLQAVPVASEAQNDTRLTIVYGSQTGNAKREAEALSQEAQSQGLSVRLLRADAYPVRELASERLLYVVISTQGDGDPPDDAQAFFEFISGRRAPQLKELKFAVLGLGDSSYPQFNAIAKKLDARLAELGGSRLFDVGEADVDVASVAAPWRQKALTEARDVLKTSTVSATITPLRPAIASSLHSREKPYAAEVLVNQRITARESEQDVRHLEIALHESLSYEPGDALGVWPRNNSALVETVLSQLKLDAEEIISIGDQTLSLHEWLSSKRELTRLGKSFVQQHATRSSGNDLNELLASENNEAISQFINQQQLPDLLNRFPGAWHAEALVNALRPLAPRLYSIASSRKAVGEEAHLAVSLLEFQKDENLRRGLASGFLADRDAGAQLPVFIERNERFRLPSDTSRDILMIGPGTGVAPYRGFVQERAEVGATGKNWLLFGARHAASEFLYQLEWQEALKKGQLHRIDLAFSRDQAERIYVQQRLRENAADVYAWLENGAHLYICGAIAMGKDVHQALLEIISTQGGKSKEAAGEYLSALQQAGRYAKDVY